MLVVISNTPSIVVTDESEALISPSLHNCKQPQQQETIFVGERVDDDVTPDHHDNGDNDDESSSSSSDSDSESACSSTILITQSKQQQQQQPSSRQVSFNVMQEVVIIPNRGQYTADELRRCHYSRVECQHLRRDCYVTLMQAKQRSKNSIVDPETTTLRGLEAQFPASYQRRSQRIKTSIHSVLNIQQQQQQQQHDNDTTLSLYSPQFMAQAYHSTTKVATKLAHQRGLMDQQAISVQGEKGIAPRLQLILR